MWWWRIAQNWSSCEHIALQTQHSIPVAEISRLPHGSHQSVNSLGLPLAVNAHGLLHGHGYHLLKQVWSEKIKTGKWFETTTKKTKQFSDHIKSQLSIILSTVSFSFIRLFHISVWRCVRGLYLKISDWVGVWWRLVWPALLCRFARGLWLQAPGRGR